MATKKKPDEITMLMKGIKATIDHNSVLPILECVCLDGKSIEFTDLETIVVVPFKTATRRTCISASKLLDALSLMKEPTITQLKKKATAEGIQERFGVEITEGKRKITLGGDNPDKMPKHPIDFTDGPDYFEVGQLTPEAFARLQTALKFVSNDDLRPAMTGVFVGDEIAATDAHRLFRHYLDEPLLEEFILPAKAIRILSVFGDEWRIFTGNTYETNEDGSLKLEQPTQLGQWIDGYRDEETQKYIAGHFEKTPIEGRGPEPVIKSRHVLFLNPNGVHVTTRTIEARFPNIKAVISVDEPKAKLIWDADLMRKELKIAGKFSNLSTHQVDFTVNSENKIHSCDIDFDHEYENVLEGAEHQGENMTIAFNGKFLDEILAELPKDEPMVMNLWSPTKCTTIKTGNDEFLLMPLMLNQ